MKNRSNLQGFDDVNNNSNPFVFKEKHVNSCKNNPISGITLIPWLMIIYKYGKYIDWKKYIMRVLFVTSLSVFNTLLSTIEYILYERRINQIQIPDNVIFILGLLLPTSLILLLLPPSLLLIILLPPSLLLLLISSYKHNHNH